jgi:hypothetical protein
VRRRRPTRQIVFKTSIYVGIGNAQMSTADFISTRAQKSLIVVTFYLQVCLVGETKEIDREETGGKKKSRLCQKKKLRASTPHQSRGPCFTMSELGSNQKDFIENADGSRLLDHKGVSLGHFCCGVLSALWGEKIIHCRSQRYHSL